MPEHARASITHDRGDLLAHRGSVAMDRAFFARGFAFSKRALGEPGQRVVLNRLAVLAETFPAVMLGTIDFGHGQD